MNKEEYNIELKKLEADFKIQKDKLAHRCAEENNSYKVGDTVTDHIGSILVEKIGTTYGFHYNDIPYSTYFGIELKKNGEPTKKGNKRLVHQINIEE